MKDSLAHVWIELLVPGAVERRRDIETLAVETELQHLRAAGHGLTLHHEHVGLLLNERTMMTCEDTLYSNPHLGHRIELQN